MTSKLVSLLLFNAYSSTGMDHHPSWDWCIWTNSNDSRTWNKAHNVGLKMIAILGKFRPTTHHSCGFQLASPWACMLMGQNREEMLTPKEWKNMDANPPKKWIHLVEWYRCCSCLIHLHLDDFDTRLGDRSASWDPLQWREWSPNGVWKWTAKAKVNHNFPVCHVPIFPTFWGHHLVLLHIFGTSRKRVEKT